MLEIEQKYTEVNAANLRAQLRVLNAGPGEEHIEEDHYFNAADRDFATTGEAFRLRRVGTKNYFTYKGPRQSGEIKIRLEREIALPDGDRAAQQHAEVLTLLGFRSVAVVRKQRISFPLTFENLAVTVCLDHVEGLGLFAEVEVLAQQEGVRAASASLQRLAGLLGLARVESRSYLRMHLERLATQTPRDPVVVTTREALRQAIKEARRSHGSIGFVPTMGALHQGHRKLIEAARSRNAFVVVSIFVNPTQFGPQEDLSRYPRPFNDDVRLCADAGVDLIFHPGPEVLYPEGYATSVDVGKIQEVFEGASRPGHFRGVATVVLKLFHLVQPDRAYFGQKDAQQVAVIRQMIRDLDIAVEMVVCPTVRETDGLALSSRNRYLDPQQRAQAVCLYQALSAAAARFAQGERDPVVLCRIMKECVAQTRGEKQPELDYAAVVDPSFATPAEVNSGATLLLAVRIGTTRLIDNFVL